MTDLELAKFAREVALDLCQQNAWRPIVIYRLAPAPELQIARVFVPLNCLCARLTGLLHVTFDWYSAESGTDLVAGLKSAFSMILLFILKKDWLHDIDVAELASFGHLVGSHRNGAQEVVIHPNAKSLGFLSHFVEIKITTNEELSLFAYLAVFMVLEEA